VCLQILLNNSFQKEKYIIILGPWITAVGAWVPVSQLAEEEVAAYRQLEEERIAKVLDDLLAICQSQKVENLLPFQISLFFFPFLSSTSTPIMPNLSMSI
jgi:hypothetical protein